METAAPLADRRPPTSSDRWARRGLPWLGAVVALVALASGWQAPIALFAAWLAAAWFALGISSGALAWLWVHRLTGGRWGAALRPVLLRLAGGLPLALLAFVPLALGAPLLYAPFHAASGTPTNVAAALATWHAPAFVAGRCVVYAVVWLLLGWRTRRARGHVSTGEAAASLLLHLVLTTLAAVDLLVAMVPNWSSSIFGLLAFAGQGCAALAAAVLLHHTTAAVESAVPAGTPPLSRDHGNLLLAAVLVWAYLSFMQLLVIWAEDLPREISWYVPRLQTDWVGVGIALVVLHLAAPLAALLLRAVKDRPSRLGVVAAVVLIAQALDAVWLVAPSVLPLSSSMAWLASCSIVGLSMMAFGGGAMALRAETAHTLPELADGRV